MKTFLLSVILLFLLCTCNSHLFVFKVGEVIMVSDSTTGEVISRIKNIYKMQCSDSIHYYSSEYLEHLND